MIRTEIYGTRLAINDKTYFEIAHLIIKKISRHEVSLTIKRGKNEKNNLLARITWFGCNKSTELCTI
jgi:hypothetical protein